ncbi:hypothetical protein BBOV_III006310 [Babesia bovis T2Bo]|uniref:Uncharacterized protein n=1 Tax=Babesia bovis TaxID=5865 RepID=A7ANQ8_BABBO|nr:hypothetical protein BBOV_III006310 [Babesia bovis T2Bo]EDO08192.1 hypothetical protein BBOV_III006310 [Babesia bovis T2Bo]|eukprot:XP_001611760.1 hypothetical protein [Babesia bovis T2Bo]
MAKHSHINGAIGMIGYMPRTRQCIFRIPRVNIASYIVDGVTIKGNHQNSQMHISRRFSHHSAQKGKYYTNRFYMKKCSSCSSWNNLVVTQCVHCLTPLGDSDIRLRTIDPLCRTANARKGEAFIEHENYVILERCFDFTIMLYPQPSAAIHISAVPNGTFYDIKNFRKTHLTMIKKMKERCDMLMKHIIAGRAGPEYLQNDDLVKHLRELTKEARVNQQKITTSDIVQHAVYGFNYPNRYSHVGMHGMLPPFKSYSVFQSPFFYPLSKVISDLHNLSQVKPYTPEEAKELYNHDIIMEDIVDLDKTFRAQYGLE